MDEKLNFKSLLEIDDTGYTKVITDGPVPWCKNDQLTFIAEQVSHHPPSKFLTESHYLKKKIYQERKEIQTPTRFYLGIRTVNFIF